MNNLVRYQRMPQPKSNKPALRNWGLVGLFIAAAGVNFGVHVFAEHMLASATCETPYACAHAQQVNISMTTAAWAYMVMFWLISVGALLKFVSHFELTDDWMHRVVHRRIVRKYFPNSSEDWLCTRARLWLDSVLNGYLPKAAAASQLTLLIALVAALLAST